MKYGQITLLVYTILMVSSISGCSNENNNSTTITRELAARLIEETAFIPGVFIPITDRETIQCFLDTRQAESYAGANFRVVGEAENYIKKIDFNPFGNTGYVALLTPTNFANVTVTGMSEKSSDSNQRAIEFNATYDFSNITKKYNAKCFEPVGISSTATAVKYDDGWRVKFNKVPAYSIVKK